MATHSSKMMLLNCCTQYASKFGKLTSGHKTGKGQFPLQSQRRAKPKNAQTTALISHASNLMLKILQARLQQYVNWEVPDVQAGFRKDRGTRDQIANIHQIIEKAREFKKNQKKPFTSVSLTTLKPLTVWITTNWKILKEMRIPDYLMCLLRNLYAIQKLTVGTRLVQNWKRTTSRLYIVTLLI